VDDSDGGWSTGGELSDGGDAVKLGSESDWAVAARKQQTACVSLGWGDEVGVIHGYRG